MLNSLKLSWDHISPTLKHSDKIFKTTLSKKIKQKNVYLSDKKSQPSEKKS